MRRTLATTAAGLALGAEVASAWLHGSPAVASQGRAHGAKGALGFGRGLRSMVADEVSETEMRGTDAGPSTNTEEALDDWFNAMSTRNLVPPVSDTLNAKRAAGKQKSPPNPPCLTSTNGHAMPPNARRRRRPPPWPVSPTGCPHRSHMTGLTPSNPRSQSFSFPAPSLPPPSRRDGRGDVFDPVTARAHVTKHRPPSRASPHSNPASTPRLYHTCPHPHSCDSFSSNLSHTFSSACIPLISPHSFSK